MYTSPCVTGCFAVLTSHLVTQQLQQALQLCCHRLSVLSAQLLSKRWLSQLVARHLCHSLSPLPLLALASQPVTDHTHCSMTACFKLYLHWSFTGSLCLITGVTACLIWRQAAAWLTACHYHVPYRMTTCINARLWREIYRQGASDIKETYCRRIKRPTFCMSQATA